MSDEWPLEERAGRTWRERARVFAPPILVSLAVLAITYHFIQPAPPSQIVIATASKSGAYFYYGEQYRILLAREGITATVRETAGSIENIRLLEAHEADLAFVQGGTGATAYAPDLRSLASLYYEPVWVFTRADTGVVHLADLRGRRIAIDREGSGTRPVALQLLGDNNVDPDAATILPLGGEDAAQALRSGSIDAAFFVVGARASVIRELLALPISAY